jgi:hypothetical protein
MTKPKVNRTELYPAILVEMDQCAFDRTYYRLAVNNISTELPRTVEQQQDTETDPREVDRYSYPWKPNKDSAT